MAQDLDANKPILEEDMLPARRGTLSGRSLETTVEGKLHRTTFAATCDICGAYPLNSFVQCFSCRARLCKICDKRMNGIPYCTQHLMEILPLSRNGHKVLMCVEAGVDDVSEIHGVTRIPKDDVKASLAFLLERKLISKSGLFTFLERKITADGLHALSVYKNVYGKEEDVKGVEEQLNGEEEGGQ